MATKNETEILIYKLNELKILRTRIKLQKSYLSVMKAEIKNGFLKNKFRSVNQITRDLFLAAYPDFKPNPEYKKPNTNQ